MKAIITAAGKNHRHLPLQTMADETGMPLSILSMQLRELRESGIEKVGIIINPGDEALYRDASGDFGDFVECIPQDRPRGYAYAILCAETFVGGAPFLLSVADHLFVGARDASNCFRQLIEAADHLDASVSAVQATPESDICRFGTIGASELRGATISFGSAKRWKSRRLHWPSRSFSFPAFVPGSVIPILEYMSWVRKSLPTFMPPSKPQRTPEV